MKNLLKALVMSTVCTATTLMAVEIPVNGNFSKNDQGKAAMWSPLAPRDGVAMELVPATDGNGNGLYLELDGKGYPIVNTMQEVTKYKKINFTVTAKGTGGFAASVLLYNEKARYLSTLLLREARPNADAMQTFTGSVEIPEEIQGQKVKFFNLQLLTFANSQVLYENVKLDGELRESPKP